MQTNDSIALVGYAAGFLTTLAFVPQALYIWRTRSARDVSLHTFCAFTVGVFLWLLYGVLKAEWPIVIWNGVTLVLAGAILGMKLRFKD
jgi:MtN3 and saliva related transmembrane protein